MSRKLIAELIGTFTLIFIGAGAGAIGAGGLVGVAFAHGLVVLAFAYAYGHISGTHINPAVTIALWAGKQIDAAGAAAYIVVQLIGGALGALALRSVLGGTASGLGATVLAPTVTPVQGFVVELLLTFFLVNTIFNTAVSGKAGNLAPVAIGLTLVFLHPDGRPADRRLSESSPHAGSCHHDGQLLQPEHLLDRPATRSNPGILAVPDRSEA